MGEEEKDNTVETLEKVVGLVTMALPLVGQVGLGVVMIMVDVIGKWNGPAQTKEQLLARIKEQQARDLSWK